MEDYIDREKLNAFNAALALAIAERTGCEPRTVNALDLGSYDLVDGKRALEIFKTCWVDLTTILG